MTPGKVLVGAVWVLSLAGYVFGGGTLASLGGFVVALLAAAHVVECAVYLPRLKRAPGSLASQLWQTFLFGFFHLRELPTDEGTAGPG